jgi:hypothetical protein
MTTLKMHQLGQYTRAMKLKLKVTFFLAEPLVNFSTSLLLFLENTTRLLLNVVILVCSGLKVIDNITREVAIYCCIMRSSAMQARQELQNFMADSEYCLD